MSDGTLQFVQRATPPVNIGANTTGLWVDTNGVLQTTSSSRISSNVATDYLMQGRLTLSSACAVTTSGITGATSIYFLPYDGDKIALYSGSSWSNYTITNGSVAPSTSACTVFDIFAYPSGSNVILETLDWSGSSVRATTLTTQNGVYVKNGDSTRRYLGTCRTTGVGGQTQDNGTKRFCYNYYNRVIRSLTTGDSNSHTYNGADRKWNNSDTNNLVEYVSGIVDYNIQGFLYCQIRSGTSGSAYVSLYRDGTSSATGLNYNNQDITAVSMTSFSSGLGYHYLQVYETSSATSTFTSSNMLIMIAI
jgi:hypothetical protein